MNHIFEDKLPNQTVVMVITWSILVAAPLIYLMLGYFISRSREPMPSAGNDVLFYLLLIVSIATPLFIPMISRLQIGSIKRQQQSSRMTPAQQVQMIVIVRVAIVEVTYIYGLIMLLLTGDWFRMFIFYAIGIAWSIVYWPTKTRQEQILKRIESND